MEELDPMNIFEAIFLGIVQGIAEFLPISSTAHIIIAEFLLGHSIPGLSFEIFLHLGSIVAVIFYFRKDIIHLIQVFFRYIAKRRREDRPEFFLCLYIVLATIITGVLGVFLEDSLGSALKTPVMIAVSLTLTGIFLIIIERAYTIGSRTVNEMTTLDAVIVGLAQTVAVIPGISRSGSTLIAALFSGLDRETSVRFSFLLSIPVILGSTVLALGDITDGSLASIGAVSLIAAFIASLITSWLGIVWLINFLNKGKLTYFAIYCFLLALVTILFLDPGSTVVE